MADYFVEENILVGLPEVKLDGISVGYLMEGKTVDVTPLSTFLPFRYGRPLLVVKQIIIEQTETVKFTFAEVNPKNLREVLTNAILDDISSPGYTIIKWGGLSSFTTKQLEIIYTKPEGRTVVLKFHKVVSISKPTIAFSQDKWTELEAEFQVLADFTKPPGERYHEWIIENVPSS